MAEELPALWDNLSLTEDECAEVKIQKFELHDVFSPGRACVVGKMIVDRMVRKETIKSTLLKWWKLLGNMAFEILGENLFLIDFANVDDKKRVLEGRPWVFYGSLFLVEDFDGTIPPSKYTFKKAAFWVRMINLPLGCMGKEIGRKIGETMGTMEVVDTDVDGIEWGEFLRVKILLDLTKPLSRGKKLNIHGDLC